MYNILITGGAGYIGSILTPFLLEKGHNITVIDNFMYKQNSLNNLCIHKNFTVINDDIRNKTSIEPLIKKADIIIPLAALVGAPLCKKDPIGSKTINHDAIIMMLNMLSSEQYLLMPTTNSAYGSGNSNNYCDETSELVPISNYAIEKVEIEKQIMQRENTTSLRLATVFGMSPRMRLDLLVNDFTYRAFHDKFIVLFESQFKRNYIHIRDVANVFDFCINNASIMKNEICNVGLSDTNISKKALCERIKYWIPEFTIHEDQFNSDPDQRNYIVSNEKILAKGFKTKFSLDDGLEELIKGYNMIKNYGYSNF